GGRLWGFVRRGGAGLVGAGEGDGAMSGRLRDGAPGRCLAVLALAGLALAGAGARAADIETRDFAVLVSGKPAGEVHMTIHRQENGNVAMRCDTDIKVSMVIGSYKFIYRGLEVWKDRRLVRFDSNTDDNGKRYIVSAVAEAGGLRVKVNNAERMARPETWLTSYWCLPDPKVRNGFIPIIDADNGKDLDSRLAYVATEKLQVAGRGVARNHYHLPGKL